MKTATLKTTKARRADPPSSIHAFATIAALTAKECDIMLAFVARKEKNARRRSINGHQATPFGQDGLREILRGFPTLRIEHLREVDAMRPELYRMLKAAIRSVQKKRRGLSDDASPGVEVTGSGFVLRLVRENPEGGAA